MSKFKVGDRVQFRERFLSYPEGYVSTVVRFDWAGDPEITKPDGTVDNFFEWDLANKVVVLRDPEPTTLTRRDRFAMAALTGLLMMREYGTYEGRVSDAFTIADLMESARNKEAQNDHDA